MIIVNARFLTQSITGVQRYAVEICKRLPQEINGKKIIYVAPKNIKDNELSESINIFTFGIFKGHLWEQIELPLFLQKNGNPVLLNLVGIAPIFYKKKIIALYDLAFRHHPEWFSYTFQKSYNKLIPVSLKNSLRIITDSEYVKTDIHNTYKINKEKIIVI